MDDATKLKKWKILLLRITGDQPGVLTLPRHVQSHPGVALQAAGTEEERAVSNLLSMSNEAILRKAIEKAQAHGYRPLMTVEGVIAHNNQFQNPIAIIFTHDFAKAFWGESYYITSDEFEDNKGIAWQYHLQQMVIAEETLKYLEKFL